MKVHRVRIRARRRDGGALSKMVCAIIRMKRVISRIVAPRLLYRRGGITKGITKAKTTQKQNSRWIGGPRRYDQDNLLLVVFLHRVQDFRLLADHSSSLVILSPRGENKVTT